MQFIDGDIAVWGVHDEQTLNQIRRCRKTAYRAALCADGHLGYSVPIGGVVAYKNAISPNGVGFDISCGNKAVLTDADSKDVKANIKTIMDDVWNTISFGVGRNNNEKVDDPLFESDLWKLGAVSPLKQMARDQLGTVGSGNHYVDIFEDEQERIWIGVHFGSRGLGHKIATFFLKEGGAKDGIDADPLVLDVDTDLGNDYVHAMTLAGEYAYAGRNWVCDRVSKILGANVVDYVHNHHNYAWEEVHGREKMWVVRKGATPAFPGQRGFVGGSMGENAVIVEGVQSYESKYSLYSTVHGAGRVMSRTAAKGKINRKTGAVIKEGAISKDMMMDWVNGAGVELRGADTDEAPQAYKRLSEVLAHHSNSIKVLNTLRPIGVAMAGMRDYDPYKD